MAVHGAEVICFQKYVYDKLPVEFGLRYARLEVVLVVQVITCEIIGEWRVVAVHIFMKNLLTRADEQEAVLL